VPGTVLGDGDISEQIKRLDLFLMGETANQYNKLANYRMLEVDKCC
jgi:hypothetical protein